MINKKAMTTLTLVIALTLGLLVLFIGYRQFQTAGDTSDGLVGNVDGWLQNIIASTNINDPCPCSTGQDRVQVEGVFHCVAQLNQEQCQRAGFSMTEDGKCYYTREQCLLVRE